MSGPAGELLGADPFGDGAKLFALRVKGNLMEAAGINEHDIAIFRECAEADPGAIVAVLPDGDEECAIGWWLPVAALAARPELASLPSRGRVLTAGRILGKLQGLIRVY